MTAYCIFQIEITDQQRYEQYKSLAPASISAYGGEFLVRGGRMEVLEGQWRPGRVVVLRFPSMEQAQAWYDSQEYADARELRHAAAVSDAVLVEGV